MFFCFLFANTISLVICSSSTELFPYGLESEDKRHCGDVNILTLTQSMFFFSKYERDIYIHKDGFITANTPPLANTSLSPKLTSLAIYHKSFERCFGGDIYFRESFNATILKHAGDVINKYTSQYHDVLQTVLITYASVTLTADASKRFTFQAIIADDGIDTYAILNYVRLDSSGAETGVSEPYCNWIKFADMENSNQLAYTTNINQTGVHVFKLTKNCKRMDFYEYGYNYGLNSQLTDSSVYVRRDDSYVYIELNFYQVSRYDLIELYVDFIVPRPVGNTRFRFREVNDDTTLSRVTDEIRAATKSNFTTLRAYLVSGSEYVVLSANMEPTYQFLIARDVEKVYCAVVFKHIRDIRIRATHYNIRTIDTTLSHDWMKTWLSDNEEKNSGGAYVLQTQLNYVGRRIELYPYGVSAEDEMKPTTEYQTFNKSSLELINEMNTHDMHDVILKKLFPSLRHYFYIAAMYYNPSYYNLLINLDILGLSYRKTNDSFTLVRVKKDIKATLATDYSPSYVTVITMTIGDPIYSKLQILIAEKDETMYGVAISDSRTYALRFNGLYKYCKFQGSVSSVTNGNVFLINNKACSRRVLYPIRGIGSMTYTGSESYTKLTDSINFFNTRSQYLYVRTDGFVSSTKTELHFDFERFPTHDTILAIFKSISSTSVLVEESKYHSTLSQASKDVESLTSSNFTAVNTILITYDYGQGAYAQAVIATDGIKTYAILNYEGILPSEGLVGYSERLCGWETYRDGLESKNLTFTSNINITGRHVLQLTTEECNVTGLYPYGDENGDQQMKRGDNIAEKIELNVPVPLPARMSNIFHISTNGLISVDEKITSKISTLFATWREHSGNFVAPYHMDLDTTQSGEIFYRETQDEFVMANVNKDIRFLTNSSMHYALIITYVDVPKHDSLNETQTFQVVLAHDGLNRSYLIFNFIHMDSPGAFEKWVYFHRCVEYKMPYSTFGSQHITSFTNVDQRGKFVYKLHDGEICSYKGQNDPKHFQVSTHGYDFATLIWQEVDGDKVTHARITTEGDWEGQYIDICTDASVFDASGLLQNQTYNIEIITKKFYFAVLQDVSPLKLAHVTDVSFAQDGIEIRMTWKTSPQLFSDVFNAHIVVSHASTDNNETMELNFTLWETTYTFNGTIGSKHTFEIRTLLNEQHSPTKNVSYTVEEDSSGSSNDELIIITSLSASAVLIILILASIFYYQRKKQKRKANRFLLSRGSNKIDPDRSILEQCNNLPYDAKFEFPRISMYLLKVLGEGAFGQVWMASATGIEHFKPRSQKKKKSRFLRSSIKKKTVVAVKTLKGNATDTEYKDLANELKLLIHIGEHRNIVNLLGACTKGDDLLVILEFCSKGALLNYVRLRRDEFEPSWDGHENQNFNLHQLTWIAVQIADGMNYLAEKKCVHRDLAARNILLTDSMAVKVADFGLARDTEGDDYYKKETEGLLPIKWMAPEAIVDQKYTSMSDIWAYGILLWEMYSLGASPYPGITNEGTLSYIKSGKRLEKPKDCPAEIYDIMLQCWSLPTELRPFFIDLRNSLDNILINKEQGFYGNQTMANLYKIDFAPKRLQAPNQTESSRYGHHFLTHCFHQQTQLIDRIFDNGHDEIELTVNRWSATSRMGGGENLVTLGCVIGCILQRYKTISMNIKFVHSYKEKPEEEKYFTKEKSKDPEDLYLTFNGDDEHGGECSYQQHVDVKMKENDNYAVNGDINTDNSYLVLKKNDDYK